jgi:hypothetical protein
MANENYCVFCGEKVGVFRATEVVCGPTVQNACKSCEKELKGLSEVELCQRALVRGIAQYPERLKNRIELITHAEEHRPACLRCGGKMIFLAEQELDNSPYKDTIFKDPFPVRPAYCEKCGKYEFFNPSIIGRDKHLAYLMYQDTHKE